MIAHKMYAVTEEQNEMQSVMKLSNEMKQQRIIVHEIKKKHKIFTPYKIRKILASQYWSNQLYKRILKIGNSLASHKYV